jgi:UDP-N-acetylmuramate: L-alanyl-gamma-D-glutamyl-meso-diaminopimelate ligase
MVVCKSTEADWGLKQVLANFTQPTALYDNVDELVSKLVPQLNGGDHVVVMSNSGFGGIHNKLLSAIKNEKSQ